MRSQRPVVARAIALALAGVLLLGATAHARPARLRPATSLKAVTSVAPHGYVVKLHWRDRARRETRWEIRRGARRIVLQANSTRVTDPAACSRVETYTYRVRPCRGQALRQMGQRARQGRASRADFETAAPAAVGQCRPPSAGAGAGHRSVRRAARRSAVAPSSRRTTPGTPTSRASRWTARGPTRTSPPSAPRPVAGFGSGLHGDYGIPYRTVPLDQPLVPIRFHVGPTSPAESDAGPYPIPGDAPIEEAGDPPPTTTCWSCVAATAGCSSCSTPRRSRTTAGASTAQRLSTCARTPCVRTAIRLRTPRDCRSSLASRAWTRSRPGRSITP